jgi:DNA-binding transcriptional ArsR family regulator
VGTEAQSESLEESIFKTLSNQKRRDILRFIGENKQVTFTEIKKAVEIEDSSSVSYHLNSLQNLITQQNEKYTLSDLGQEAYNLIIKTNSYTSTNVIVNYLRRQLFFLVIANALTWALAIFSVRYIEGPLDQMTLFNLAFLWLISNAMIYFILRTTNKNQNCQILRMPKKS